MGKLDGELNKASAHVRSTVCLFKRLDHLIHSPKFLMAWERADKADQRRMISLIKNCNTPLLKAKVSQILRGDIEAMSRRELIAAAQDACVENYSNMVKSELVGALKERKDYDED